MDRAASSSRRARERRRARRSTRCSRRNRQGAHFALDTTFLFDEMPSFRDTLDAPRAASDRSACAIRRCATQMRTEIADPRGRSFVFVWQVLRVETVERPEHERYVDRTVHRDRARSGTPIRSTRSSTSRSPKISRTQFVLRRAAEPEAPGRDRDAHPVADRDARQQRRRRAPALVLRRRLHDPAAHGVGPTC